MKLYIVKYGNTPEQEFFETFDDYKTAFDFYVWIKGYLNYPYYKLIRPDELQNN